MIETLKGRLVEVDKDFENLSGDSLESQNKINHLTELLREEVMKNEENGRAVECLEVIIVIFRLYVGSVLTSRFKYFVC